jgi:hypothetical protein
MTDDHPLQSLFFSSEPFFSLVVLNVQQDFTEVHAYWPLL